ncbi:MAG: ATP-binding protein [Oscillospiraceae bacterium]|jgi:DNA replication protein DnaC
MITDQYAIAYANSVLNRRRMKYRLITEQCMDEAYSKCPGLKELDNEISDISAENAKARLTGGTERPLDDLIEKRSFLMKEHGVTEEDFKPKHFCPKCGDTGYIGENQRCSCFLELLSKYEQEKISAVSPLKLCSFEDFSLDYYSSDVDPEMGRSPRDNMKKVLSVCREFAEQFPDGTGNLLMTGSAGLGKTHLALSIARRVIERGYGAVYCSTASVFSTIDDEKFGRKQGDTLGALKNCDLLVLDDLGAEFISASISASIYDVINSRINSGRGTVITTNITDEDTFSIRYGEKTCSRILYCSRILPFYGEDIRKLLRR